MDGKLRLVLPPLSSMAIVEESEEPFSHGRGPVLTASHRPTASTSLPSSVFQHGLSLLPDDEWLSFHLLCLSSLSPLLGPSRP